MRDELKIWTPLGGEGRVAQLAGALRAAVVAEDRPIADRIQRAMWYYANLRLRQEVGGVEWYQLSARQRIDICAKILRELADPKVRRVVAIAALSPGAAPHSFAPGPSHDERRRQSVRVISSDHRGRVVEVRRAGIDDPVVTGFIPRGTTATERMAARITHHQEAAGLQPSARAAEATAAQVAERTERKGD